MKSKKKVLIVEIQNKENIIKDITVQEENALTRIETAKSELNTLEIAKKAVNGEIRSLKDDIIDQETVIEKNKLKIENLEFTISELEIEKEKISKELEIQNQEKTAFMQAKIVLQRDREELTNRELFIMEKYELAGLPYKGDMLATTKGFIADKADLQQTKEDLDKRELFIKAKFEKAGIPYM